MPLKYSLSASEVQFVRGVVNLTVGESHSVPTPLDDEMRYFAYELHRLVDCGESASPHPTSPTPSHIPATKP